MASCMHVRLSLMALLILLVASGTIVIQPAHAEATMVAHNVPVSILAPCSRTRDKNACIEFLSAFPEAQKATTVAPLAELYLQAIANRTMEGKEMASKQLAIEKGKGVPPVCLEQCATSIDAMSNALASFFSTTTKKDVDDVNKKYREMDRFLTEFLRKPIARKQMPICQSVCPIRSCSLEEMAVADKFKEAWKLLSNADGLITQIVPAVQDKATSS
uniref:Pectinesterase inhibitor domain-containing protein n=2 Tax=Oryza brachyantha TaxID=4533 RepID=J3LIW2_ORYBR